MIKTINLVPEVLYSRSRDFQFLGRSFDVVFNYAKMNIDLMSGLPLSANTDDSMMLLVSKTLGFETRHQYNSQDLKNICSVFIDLVRNKGTKSAIERAVRTLMNAQNISGTPKVNVDRTNHVLRIYVPYGLKDLVLLEDLFDYILPAGFDYRFIYGAQGENTLKANTISVESVARPVKVSDGLIGKIVRTDGEINEKRPDDSTSDIADDGVATTFTSKIVDGRGQN